MRASWSRCDAIGKLHLVVIGLFLSLSDDMACGLVLREDEHLSRNGLTGWGKKRVEKRPDGAGNRASEVFDRVQ